MTDQISKKTDQKGFTLVELIIAVAILAIAIGPAFTAFVSASNVNKRSTILLRATELTSSMMEKVNTTSFHKLKGTFTSASEFVIFNEFGYSATQINTVNASGIASIEDFKDRLATIYGNTANDVQNVYYASDASNIYLAVMNVPYDHVTYDILFQFKKNIINIHDKYYTWNVTIDSFDVDHNIHFNKSKLNEITGSVIDYIE